MMEPRYKSGEAPPLPGDLIRGPEEVGDRELVAIVLEVLGIPGNDLAVVPIGWVEKGPDNTYQGVPIAGSHSSEKVHLTRCNRRALMQSTRCELLHRWRGKVEVILEVFQTVR